LTPPLTPPSGAGQSLPPDGLGGCLLWMPAPSPVSVGSAGCRQGFAAPGIRPPLTAGGRQSLRVRACVDQVIQSNREARLSPDTPKRATGMLNWYLQRVRPLMVGDARSQIFFTTLGEQLRESRVGARFKRAVQNADLARSIPRCLSKLTTVLTGPDHVASRDPNPVPVGHLLVLNTHLPATLRSKSRQAWRDIAHGARR
jgi:hypothetical protein